MRLFLAVFTLMVFHALSPFSAGAQTRMPRLSDADKAIWQGCLKRTVMRPPCCGACPLFTLSDAKVLMGFLANENPADRGERLWKLHQKRLLKEFEKTAPTRYETLYKGLQAQESPPLAGPPKT